MQGRREPAFFMRATGARTDSANEKTRRTRSGGFFIQRSKPRWPGKQAALVGY
jgi:hypothetical protein